MSRSSLESKREELKRTMRAAGFKVSNAIDESIDLLLERTREQIVEAGTEITRSMDVRPGFLAITQDYMLFAKRNKKGWFPQPDVFIALERARPYINGTVLHQGQYTISTDTPYFVATRDISLPFTQATRDYSGHIGKYFSDAELGPELKKIAEYLIRQAKPKPPPAKRL
jgi:hypothetical protein